MSGAPGLWHSHLAPSTATVPAIEGYVLLSSPLWTHLLRLSPLMGSLCSGLPGLPVLFSWHTRPLALTILISGKCSSREPSLSSGKLSLETYLKFPLASSPHSHTPTYHLTAPTLRSLCACVLFGSYPWFTYSSIICLVSVSPIELQSHWG